MNSVVVFFGAGGAGKAYLEHSGVTPDFFVDNNPNLAGSYVANVEVRHPSVLRGMTGLSVVITSGYIDAIRRQLDSLGVPSESVTIVPKSMMGQNPFATISSRVLVAHVLGQFISNLSNGTLFVAGGGTALGFARDRDFIPWDFDMDFFAPASERENIEETLDKNRHRIRASERQKIDGEFIINDELKVPFGLAFIDTEQETYIDTYLERSWCWPTEMFIKPDALEVHGFLFSVPRNVEDYLVEIYGGDWATPRPDFTYDDYGGLA